MSSAAFGFEGDPLDDLRLVDPAYIADTTAFVCRICGCTDDNACLGRDGAPCHWVTGDLCSACMEV